MSIRSFILATMLALIGGFAFAANLTGPEGGWMNKAITGPNYRSTNSPLTPCGTGVIDLSAGCTLPIMLGLVP